MINRSQHQDNDLLTAADATATLSTEGITNSVIARVESEIQVVIF